MAIREKLFAKIQAVYKRHGAVTIDTPVAELKVSQYLELFTLMRQFLGYTDWKIWRRF